MRIKNVWNHHLDHCCFRSQATPNTILRPLPHFDASLMFGDVFFLTKLMISIFPMVDGSPRRSRTNPRGTRWGHFTWSYLMDDGSASGMIISYSRARDPPEPDPVRPSCTTFATMNLKIPIKFRPNQPRVAVADWKKGQVARMITFEKEIPNNTELQQSHRTQREKQMRLSLLS